MGNSHGHHCYGWWRRRRGARLVADEPNKTCAAPMQFSNQAFNNPDLSQTSTLTGTAMRISDKSVGEDGRKTAMDSGYGETDFNVSSLDMENGRRVGREFARQYQTECGSGRPGTELMVTNIPVGDTTAGITVKHLDRRAGDRVTRSCRRGLKKADEMRLLRNFRYLKEELDPLLIIDALIVFGDIDEDEMEQIMHPATRRMRVGELVLKILRFRETSFQHFVDALHSTDYGYVADKLENSNTANGPRETEYGGLTVAAIEQILSYCREEILDQLEVYEILDFFVEGLIISVEESILILKEPGRIKQAEVLLKRIERKLPHSYAVLLEALEKTKAEYLLEVLTQIQEDGVPEDEGPTSVAIDILSQQLNHCSMDIETGEGRRLASIDLRLVFQDTTEGPSHVTVDLLEYLRTPEGRAEATEAFMPAHALFVDGMSGSVVIRLEACSPLTYRRIVALCESGKLAEIFEKFFNKHGAVRALKGGRTTVKVDIVGTWRDKKSSDELREQLPQTSIEERFEAKFPIFLEELDALSCMKDLCERKMFTKEEASLITRPRSRRMRTEQLLKAVLKKGIKCIAALVEVLRKTRSAGLVEGILNPMSETDADDFEEEALKVSFLDNSSRILDEISPRHLGDALLELGVLDANLLSTIRHTHAGNRRVHACVLFGKVLEHGSSVKCLKALEISGCSEPLLASLKQCPIDEGEATSISLRRPDGRESESHTDVVLPTVSTTRDIFKGEFALKPVGKAGKSEGSKIEMRKVDEKNSDGNGGTFGIPRSRTLPSRFKPNVSSTADMARDIVDMARFPRKSHSVSLPRQLKMTLPREEPQGSPPLSCNMTLKVKEGGKTSFTLAPVPAARASNVRLRLYLSLSNESRQSYHQTVDIEKTYIIVVLIKDSTCSLTSNLFDNVTFKDADRATIALDLVGVSMTINDPSLKQIERSGQLVVPDGRPSLKRTRSRRRLKSPQRRESRNLDLDWDSGYPGSLTSQSTGSCCSSVSGSWRRRRDFDKDEEDECGDSQDA